MKLIAIDKTRITLSTLLRMAERESVILTRGGKPLAAVKDVSNGDWESIALANNPEFIRLVRQSRRSYQREGGTSLERLRAELGLPRNKSRRGSDTRLRRTRARHRPS